MVIRDQTDISICVTDFDEIVRNGTLGGKKGDIAPVPRLAAQSET